MRKTLFGVAFMLYSSFANAAGLYLSAGYGKADPDMKASDLSCVWSDTSCYGDASLLPGWPVQDEANANVNSDGYIASQWEAGLKQEYSYNMKGDSTFSVAIGWDIPQNPFRFELEYLKTKYKADGYVLSIFDPEGAYVNPSTYDPVSNTYEDYYQTSRYDFDIFFDQPGLSGDMKAYLANVYFEIPGFGALDPYIGFGLGKAKFNWDISNVANGGSDGNVDANQLIAGLEYRLKDSPVILGVEYRQLKADFDERDDLLPYEYEHKYVMFKLRYDFISNNF